MYKETAEFIISELTNKRVEVEMTDEMFSQIDYSVHGEGDIVESSDINRIYLAKDNSFEKVLYRKFPEHQAHLIQLYGSDLFVILHEIGHAKTVVGLSLPSILKKKAQVENILDHRERSRAYRNLPTERRADKWAFHWLLKHPKQARYYQQMLELAREG